MTNKNENLYTPVGLDVPVLKSTVSEVIQAFADEQGFKILNETNSTGLNIYILGYSQPGEETTDLSPTTEDIETMWGFIINRLELVDDTIPWRELLSQKIEFEGDLHVTLDETVLKRLKTEAAEKFNFGIYEREFTEVLDEYLNSVPVEMHVRANDDVFSFTLSSREKGELTEAYARDVVLYLQKVLRSRYPERNWDESFFITNSDDAWLINLDYALIGNSPTADTED